MATYPSYPAEQYAQPYAQPAADPYHAAAYAAPAYAPAPAAYGYNPDELRTVFLTGFPDDVKERELNNLLRFLPGYEAREPAALRSVRNSLGIGLDALCVSTGLTDALEEQPGWGRLTLPLFCSLALDSQNLIIHVLKCNLFLHSGSRLCTLSAWRCCQSCH